MEILEIVKKILAILWDMVVQLALGREGYRVYKLAERRKRVLKINRLNTETILLEAEADIKERRLSIREREGEIKLKIARDRVKTKQLRKRSGSGILSTILNSKPAQKR